MSAIDYDDILVTENDNLKIYVIGYNYQGESIVITIGEDKFVGVIDCYRTKDEFITKRILEDLKINRLDFVCWTHTDWDHTKGLSQLKKYVKKDTVIILPEGMSAREIDDLINENTIKKSYKKEFNQIFEMTRKVQDDYQLKVNQTSTIFDFNLYFPLGSKKYRFIIDCFAPISGVVNEYMGKTIKEFYENIDMKNGLKELNKNWTVDPNRKNNLYSIGLSIVINSENERISICLCGDLDNITINKMSESKRNKIFNKNTILKIPHHGSENADDLFNLNCIKEFKYGVTTSFRNKLPNSEMLVKYKQKCSKLSRTDLKKGKYGVVTYTINLKDLNVLEPEYESSAGEH